MSKVHLITGYKGEEHIKAADQGSFNASFFGGGEYVMEAGNQFEASIMDNNTVRILDGDLLMQGRHIRIEPETYEDITITTGTAGMNRIDLIVMQYSKDTSTDIETAQLVVVKGTETEGNAAEPTYSSGNILSGATFNQMPLYRVKVEGVVLTDIEPLFNVIPTYKTLAEKYARQFQEACDTYIGLLNILDTMEEVEANTQEGQLAGALSLKELKNTLQSAIDAKVTNSFTGERALIAGTNGMVTTSGTTSTELYMLHGIKSNVQTQLDGKVPSGGSARVASVSFNDSAVIYSTDENLNFQYKDSAGNLQGMNMDYIATRLANALLKWGGTMTGRLETDKSLGMGLGSGSYAIAPIVINADTLNNEAIRSGIGFHNQGRNGTCLYLDLDGALKHVDSAGVSRVLMDSRNFQYDASTQTLNITL